ncbi:MAG: dTMP kinase [Comamonadaceae bacterium CG1_02_60_18]|nr:MAG: dTMP kinase [Comamonadaceae bacterium CG1_02_60_18]PIQ53901.1 MAG: dTMP kinase [Comamonadaceae bacterium CG12_big_fil_rev_8_21_14_0_65_59_15]
MAIQGLFISFEGIDGAGKSTHIDALARAFEAQGRVVTTTREPGGTLLAEKLRAMILGDAMDAMTEALLVFAARRDHLQQVIEPALARAEVVLCDRFTDATFAYQGSGRGFDLKTLLFLERLVQTQQGPAGDFVRNPDLTVWFDLAPDIAAQRLAGTRVPDKFEAQPAAFFQRVSDGYLQRMQAAPNRFARINADQPRESVWRDVLAAFQRQGWLA